jgi:hypothetical protein
MRWSSLRTRAALGLAPAAVPAMVYVPLGVALGPHGLHVLSGDVLAHLDPVVSVTLATLGVLVGIAVTSRWRGAGRLMGTSILESGVTLLIVGGAVWFLLGRWDMPTANDPWLLAIVLGSCAAASSAGAADAGTATGDRLAMSIADLDDLVPIVAGAAALALAVPRGRPVGTQMLLGAAVGLAAGAIGWMLFERADDPGERGVFVLGTLALLGGASAYLDLSPMLAGLVCGACWRLAPGHADKIVADDLRRYHHPCVLLLLIYAGAQMQPRLAAVWLFVPFVLFRLTGKLMAGAAASRLHAAIAADALGAYLIPPGVIGVALALNLNQIAGGPGALVVTVVAAGTVAFEAISIAAMARPT